jgi:hypothetical protein
MNVRDTYWPMSVGTNPEVQVNGYLLSIGTTFMMILVIVLLISAGRRCLAVLTGKAAQLAHVEG